MGTFRDSFCFMVRFKEHFTPRKITKTSLSGNDFHFNHNDLMPTFSVYNSVIIDVATETITNVITCRFF